MSTNTKLDKAKEKLGNLKECIVSHKPATGAIPECVEQISPSTNSGRIKYFNRIDKKIKENFQKYQEITDVLELEKNGPTGSGAEVGKRWHSIMKDYIDKSSKSDDEQSDDDKIAEGVIDALKKEFKGIEFLQSEFPLYGYMVPKEDSEEIYFWNGKADAIGWYENNYVIVDWKAVGLLEFWEKNKHAYGSYLHQCLVYARLLKLHLKLGELPYILIVPINNITGKDITPGLFDDFPVECIKELDKYQWSEKYKPIRKRLRLPRRLVVGENKDGLVDKKQEVHKLFKYNCTVEQMLVAFGFDELEVFTES